jgi:hypothetical protein
MATGDMEKLRGLLTQVEAGWHVKVTNHDYVKGSGERVVTRVYEIRDQTFQHEGETHLIRAGGPAYASRDMRSGQGFYYQFPVEGEDFEVDGLELCVYNPSHAYCGGNRAIVLTLVYSPPTA